MLIRSSIQLIACKNRPRPRKNKAVMSRLMVASAIIDDINAHIAGKAKHIASFFDASARAYGALIEFFGNLSVGTVNLKL
jgi:hypothetical protein